MEALTQLDTLLQTFWYLAIPASLVFLIQTVMTFIGVDSGDGIDADFDGDMNGDDAPFQLFSFRNLVNFLLGFSWGGISLYTSISNKALLIAVAFLIGAAFIFLFFLMMKQVQKLAEDNTFQIKDTVGKTGSVYLRIPASKDGNGLVQISVNGTVQELKAMTEGEEIPSGSMIKVVELLNDSILLVEKI